MIVFIWLLVIVVTLVLYLRQVYSKLAELELNHLPVIPVLGNMAKVAIRTEHISRALQKGYEAFPEDRIIGHYEFLNPVVLIRDRELLKSITVKDFEYFVDRRGPGEQNNPILGRNLLLLKGDEWKAMRSTLSPAFTSSKIRLMVPFMLEVGDKMLEQLKTKINDSKGGYIDIDVKDLSSRYANDVIATCAFGLQVNSQTEDSEFYVKARELTTFTFTRLLKFLGFRSMPALMKKLDIALVPVAVGDFFKNIVLGNMRQREKHNIVRHDMINLLLEAKKGTLSHDTKATTDIAAGFATVEESDVGKKQIKKEWTDNDLIAQAIIFLLAGYETVSTEVSFLLHELALNPDVQEKLLQEIRENEAKNDGKFDYNSIQHMVYLDMVISETLRMWPAVPMVDRICVKDYNAGKPNKQATKDLIIQKGQSITIPIWSFHRDPEYFPEPDKFIPERFSEENRHKIQQFTYMPFGLGPRNCIGSRFALCEVKVMVYQILRHLEVSPCEKTTIPSKLETSALAVKMAGGHWLRLRLRE